MALTTIDIKRLNAFDVLKSMYRFHHATMIELAKVTGFSASAIKTTLKTLEDAGIIEKTTLDLSTGGRCPARYAFQKNQFITLGLFIDEETVDITIRDITSHDYYQNHVYIKETKELEDFIVSLVARYQVKCVSVAAAGVVEGLCFYRDEYGKMVEYAITEHLKRRLTIPVVIENDVRAMMMGYQSNHLLNNVAYLYLNKSGVGSSYCLDTQIWRGSNRFSGEIGLMPFHGQKINDIMKQHPDTELMKQMLIQMIVTISTLIDPEKIVITGKMVPWHLEEEIYESCIACLTKKYPLHMEFRNFPLQDAIDGLHYLAVLRLFEVYTNFA